MLLYFNQFSKVNIDYSKFICLFISQEEIEEEKKQEESKLSDLMLGIVPNS